MTNLILSKTSEKEFAKLPKIEKRKVLKKLKSIQLSPLLGKPLTGELKSYYSVRAWPYRIIYEFIKSEETIVIHKIQHRQGVYKH